jgi:hypothetical protein
MVVWSARLHEENVFPLVHKLSPGSSHSTRSRRQNPLGRARLLRAVMFNASPRPRRLPYPRITRITLKGIFFREIRVIRGFRACVTSLQVKSRRGDPLCGCDLYLSGPNTEGLAIRASHYFASTPMSKGVKANETTAPR